MLRSIIVDRRIGYWYLLRRPEDKFRIRRVIRIDHKEVLGAAAQHTVDPYLAALDTDDCACTGIGGLVLPTAPVREDDNDLIVWLSPNNRIKPSKPVSQGFHIWLIWHLCIQLWVVLSNPCHGDDDKPGSTVENMMGELEIMPRCLELVRTGKFVRITTQPPSDELIGTYLISMHMPIAVFPNPGSLPLKKPSPSSAHVSSV